MCLYLKFSALIPFYTVLEGTLDHLSGKVLVLMVQHFSLKVLMKYNKVLVK